MTGPKCVPPFTSGAASAGFARGVSVFIGLLAGASAAAAQPRPVGYELVEAPSWVSEGDEGAHGRAEPIYRFDPYTVCPYCVGGSENTGRRGLHWHENWNRVGVTEYITLGVAAATAVTTHFLLPPSETPSWRGPVFFDRPAREMLRLSKEEHRRVAATTSDVLASIALVQPLVIDTLWIASIAKGADDVAHEMLFINLQAYSLTFAINGLTKRLTNRARPWVDGCETGAASRDCEASDRYRSFYSGHAALTATGAGLVCAHHTQLMLYGDPLLDLGACLLAVAGTATTGVMRIAADYHWASDVIVGHLAGYLSGYLMPTLLYYKELRLTPRNRLDRERSKPPAVMVLPFVSDEGGGLTAVGVL